MKPLIKNAFFYFIYAFLGTFATLYVRLLNINAIVASSIIAIIISVYAITRQDEDHKSWAAFCGTFAGMSSFHLVHSNLSFSSPVFFINAIIISTIVAILYSTSEILTSRYKGIFFDGYGGRLGTIAFISTFVYIGIKAFVTNQSFTIFFNNEINISKIILILSSIASATIGAMISMEIKNAVSSLNDNYKVLTVAITGIIGGILLTKVPEYGMHLGAAWYTGAFVGMSSYFILMLKRHFFIAGLLSGILYASTLNIFVGIGGKLGFISFLSVLIMRIVFKLIDQIKSFQSTDKVIEAIGSGEKISDKQVNDEYAEKLVESLLAAKKSGISIDAEHTESFAIPEPNKEETFAEQLAYLNNINYICFKEFGGQYAMYLSEQATTSNVIFNKNDKFIQIIEKKNKILSFSEKGYNQTIFVSNFLEEDLNGTSLLSIIPLYDDKSLTSFFVVFDKNDINSAKSNLDIIKSMIQV